MRVERDEDGVVVVTFSVPKTLNSMTARFVDELGDVLEELGRDVTVRAIVLTGEGRGFSSGHDLAEMAGDTESLSIPAGYEVQNAYARLIVRIKETPHPVIAAVNGVAAGGGLAIALAADTRVCSESARFNCAFVRLGISGCDVGMSYLLPRVVGPTLAFEMMMTGRLVAAQEALRNRLVLDVVPDGEVVEAAVRIARDIVRNSPFAIRMTKQVMWANLDAPSLQSAIELENRTQMVCVMTEDAREALGAFVEKRRPAFRNR